MREAALGHSTRHSLDPWLLWIPGVRSLTSGTCTDQTMATQVGLLNPQGFQIKDRQTTKPGEGCSWKGILPLKWNQAPPEWALGHFQSPSDILVFPNFSHACVSPILGDACLSTFHFQSATQWSPFRSSSVTTKPQTRRTRGWLLPHVNSLGSEGRTGLQAEAASVLKSHSLGLPILSPSSTSCSISGSRRLLCTNHQGISSVSGQLLPP